MSVIFEPRSFHGDLYPTANEHDVSGLDRFAEADVSDVADLAAVAATTYANHAASSPFIGVDTSLLEEEMRQQQQQQQHQQQHHQQQQQQQHSPAANVQPLLSSPQTKEGSPLSATQSRSKAIPKPHREVAKDVDGKFHCSWPDCTEEVKDFGRKCEWSKHMDKHERPYRCSAEGCEKLPGFTYSGGLLRHEREVHGKHGGPKNPLHCPHPNCKRHSGKGFSRQENLSEHLRRVHTGTAHNPSGGEETDDAASDGVPMQNGGSNQGIALGSMLANTHNNNNNNNNNGTGTTESPNSTKRKRDLDDLGIGSTITTHHGPSLSTSDPEIILREENRRLAMENAELRKQVEAQNVQTVAMMSQIMQMRETLEQFGAHAAL